MNTHKNDLASNIEGLNGSFQKLRDDRITKEDHYNDTGNLLGCIDVIVDYILQMLEYADDSLEKEQPEAVKMKINEIRECSFKITTLLEVIKERVDNSNYIELQNLLYYYRKIKEQAPDCTLTTKQS